MVLEDVKPGDFLIHTSYPAGKKQRSLVKVDRVTATQVITGKEAEVRWTKKRGTRVGGGGGYTGYGESSVRTLKSQEEFEEVKQEMQARSFCRYMQKQVKWEDVPFPVLKQMYSIIKHLEDDQVESVDVAFEVNLKNLDDSGEF